MNRSDDGAVGARWLEFRGRWEAVEAEVIEEALVTIYVNGRELATIMCTPRDQTSLALGLLKNEGRLERLDEVVLTHVSRDGCCVDLWLRHPVEPPTRTIVTSGCGGGVTFDDPARPLPPLTDDLRLSPAQLVEQLNRLHFPGSLHARTRGVHAAGLSDGERLLARVEDVGRHNTIDKLTGECLQRGIETRGRALLATGRVSSEMLRKGAHLALGGDGGGVERHSGRLRPPRFDARLRPPGAAGRPGGLGSAAAGGREDDRPCPMTST